MVWRRARRLSAIAIAAASVGAAQAGGPDIRSCEFTAKAGCVSGSVRVTLAGGTVQRLETNVIWCSLPGHLDFTCTVDSSRGDEDSQWSDEAGATLIANRSPFNPVAPDRVKVTVGRDVSIDFNEAQSLGRCGAGAELPRAVVVPAHDKTCRVWMSPE